MKIVIVSFFYERLTAEEDLLKQNYTITGWAEALQRKGVEVVVMNRFYKDSHRCINNIPYFFVADRFKGILRPWQIPLTFLKKIGALEADIIHLHHLTLSLQTVFLRFLLGKKTGIIVQHHGGISPSKLKRRFHNFFHKTADGFFFSTIQQGHEWFMKNNFDKIMPVMEGATFFNYPQRDAARPAIYYNRHEARKRTMVNGSPVFLWVGRLDSNKDPLTIIEGFNVIFDKYEKARLYMIYTDEKLYTAIHKNIQCSDLLKRNIHLLGKISHEEMEWYYSSADYFVLGSHYEGSGYALSEALLCGCVPIVTNIPSFKMMTDNGRLGSLWEPGSKDSFIEAVDKAVARPLVAEAAACVEFYKTHLSFDAIAATAIAHYRKIMNRRVQKQSKTRITK